MLKRTLVVSLFSTAIFSVNAESMFDHADNYATKINYDSATLNIGFGSDLTAFDGGFERMLNENVIVGGDVTFSNFDIFGIDYSVNGFTGKALYRMAASEDGDFVFGGHLGYGWSELSGYGSKYTDNSLLLGAQAGYRHAVSDELQLGGALVLANAYSNTEFIIKADATYNINSDFGIGASLATGSEVGHTETMFGIHGRYNF
jgi:hypothetical protein